MLEILRDHYGIVESRMKNEIQRMHVELIEILKSKKIDYAGLRSALVPSMDKEEAIFLFDSSAIDTGLYGWQIFNHLLPLLDSRSTQSILVGDLIGEDQRLIYEILSESLVPSRSFIFKHSTLIYGVYINNLSSAAAENINEGLIAYGPYIGYIPTTYQLRAKIYASTTMVGFLLKKGKTIIMAHEDDRSNAENVNITLYNLEQSGYSVASLQCYYFSIFLSYKIERPSYYIDTSDIEIALNSIANNVKPLEELDVILDDAKHGYLMNEKLGKMRKAGLEKADRAQIECLIKQKVSNSYIYNLMYLEDHDVMKFNIMLELDREDGYPTRMTAVLEYMPTKGALRVISFH
ncbi:MAG: hypothetical protein ACJAS1_002995 [Oleiphilaceae bacterium]|jgi:hypothetical protein